MGAVSNGDGCSTNDKRPIVLLGPGLRGQTPMSGDGRALEAPL
jgi:hypothetical protein